MKVYIVWSDDAWEDPYFEAVYATPELGEEHMQNILKNFPNSGLDTKYDSMYHLYDKSKPNGKRIWMEEYEVMTVVCKQ